MFFKGIYEGEGKPSDLDAYLGLFVKEMKELEENGLVITLGSTESRIQVKIRAFICDSPARALIKGKFRGYLFFDTYIVLMININVKI